MRDVKVKTGWPFLPRQHHYYALEQYYHLSTAKEQKFTPSFPYKTPSFPPEADTRSTRTSPCPTRELGLFPAGFPRDLCAGAPCTHPSATHQPDFQASPTARCNWKCFVSGFLWPVRARWIIRAAGPGSRAQLFVLSPFLLADVYPLYIFHGRPR